jgi:hypothetical protein
MSAVLKSTTKSNNNTYTGTELSSWSRQQKFAMLAGFAILAVVLVVCACSKQSQKHELAGLSGGAPSVPSTPALTAPQTQPPQTVANASPATPAPAKKAARKRPVNLAYSDPNSGVSFVYPRKFPLSTGDKAQPKLDDDAVPMNFTAAGGATVATVAVPKALYPGTDFASAFFTVNVNRALSEEQCSHFAFVDTSNADGEPVDAEKVKVGSADMDMTSEFAGSATKQAEAQYYHNYENGACYEYVLGLGTAGYGVSEGVQPVNRDEVFARLEKILATVKIRPTEQGQEQVQQQSAEAERVIGSAEAAK